MAATLLLDANVVLRYLTNDVPAMADACERLFERAAKGHVALKVTDVCLAELAWTLGSFYRLSPAEVADKLTALINMPGLLFSNVDILLEALDRYRSHSVDFIDAYHAAVAVAHGVPVCSYDRDYNKFADVHRKEP
jgi:predicted nucleic acid-binding protein